MKAPRVCRKECSPPLLTVVMLLSVRFRTRKMPYASARGTRGPTPSPPGRAAAAAATSESFAASGLHASGTG